MKELINKIESQIYTSEEDEDHQMDNETKYDQQQVSLRDVEIKNESNE